MFLQPVNIAATHGGAHWVVNVTLFTGERGSLCGEKMRFWLSPWAFCHSTDEFFVFPPSLLVNIGVVAYRPELHSLNQSFFSATV